MEPPVKIFFFGSLEKDRGGKAGYPTVLEVTGPTPLARILERLALNPGRVQLAMVNHRAVAEDYAIQPGDRVALFPHDYPIFADWKDFRSAASDPPLPVKDPKFRDSQ